MAVRKPKNAGLLKLEPTEVHNGLAAFITATVGVETSAATVSLIQRAYPLYLKSPVVAKARDAERAHRESVAAEKAAAKAEKARERLARLDEQRAKLLKSLGLEEDGEPETPVVIEAADRFEEPSEPEEPEEVTLDADEDEFTDDADTDADEEEW